MKVLQTISGFGTKSGGTTTCTYDLIRYLHRLGSGPVDLLTLDVDDPADQLAGTEDWIKVLPNDSRTPLAFSKNYKQFLQAADYDLYHANGLWQYPTHITAATARAKQKPFVLTPHGMLYPAALARSAWKKKLMSALWFRKDIMTATCLHATCQPELDVIRRYGYTGPVALIPNPVPLFDDSDAVAVERKPRIGFLGRLHPVKRVDVLIEAWTRLGEKTEGAELMLLGSGTRAYEQQLRAKASACKYGKITFQGFVNGREKFAALASLKALCLVSDFENFGMTVTEALSVGTPVIASHGTPWEELNTEGCGWWIDASVENIADAMAQALSLDVPQLATMGAKGRQLVATKYAAEQVAEMMHRLYQWLNGEGGRPEFVFV